MHATDIERNIRSFIVNNFLFGRADALKEDGSLGAVVDSTGAIELVCFLEERFGITVDDADVIPENFESIRAVTDYVARKLNCVEMK